MKKKGLTLIHLIKLANPENVKFFHTKEKEGSFTPLLK